MAYLCEELNSAAVNGLSQAEQNGAAFQAQLKIALARNPGCFQNFTTQDIADTLQKMRGTAPDTEILVSLYKAFDLKSNHAFRAWDFRNRATLMRNLSSGGLESDLKTSLSECNQAQADIYGFKADMILFPVKPPVPFADGTEIISHGCRDRQTKTIDINTYKPDAPDRIVPKFHRGLAEAASLVLHEGRHTFQDQMNENHPHPEFRAIATIMRLSVSGDYYLNRPRVDFDTYMLNPSEQDAYDFESDMSSFLAASLAERQSLIRQMEMRANYHQSVANRNDAAPLAPAPMLVAA